MIIGEVTPGTREAEEFLARIRASKQYQCMLAEWMAEHYSGLWFWADEDEDE